MKIDLHIHTSTGSDGALSVEEAFKEARQRNLDLISITDRDSIDAQERAIALSREYGIDYITGVEYILEYIDGVECWHSRNDAETTAHYTESARKHRLLMTGGSDCHQKPVLTGTVDVPDFAASQFSPLCSGSV